MARSKRSRWLILATMMFLLFGWASSGVTIYIRLFFIITFLLLGSYLWSMLALQGIQISRRSRSLRTSVGKVFDERFDVINYSRWACLWLEIENLSLLPHKNGSRLLTGIGSMQQRSYMARSWVTKRGAFPLGPTLSSAGDPFGVFVSSRLEPAHNTLIVLPMTVEIPYFPSPIGILPGGKAIRQKTLDVTPHATGVREYIAGDPMKRVHWPSTAKHEHFMVKTYEQDPQAEIWFFLDSQQVVQFTHEIKDNESSDEVWGINRRRQIKLPEDSYEYAVSITASLVKYFLKEKRAVGLVSSGSKFTVVPAERGERQTGKVLETLAFFQADGNLPLLGVITMQAKYLPMGSGVLLVTPSLNTEIIFAVEDLVRRNLHPMVILIIANSNESGSTPIVNGLEMQNVPFIKIVCGVDLEKQLRQIPNGNQKAWTPS
jgi:uncharacterized protein (DUF58 family)